MQNYIPRLNSFIFPNPELAPDSLPLAWGGDLSSSRLLKAYQEGIFPWYNGDDPILWWSPSPRLILYPEEFKISKSLKKRLKREEYITKIDSNFDGVIQNCASIYRENQDGTWILDEVISAYSDLFRLGYAHSFESYTQDGELVGGLYGVSLGGAFFGESMFSKVNDSSKVALAKLVEFAKREGFDFIDCQVPTEHLKSLGAIEISRERFLSELKESLKTPTLVGNWGEL